MLIIHVNPSTNRSKEVCEPSRHRPAPSSCIGTAISHKICRCKLLCPINRRFRNCDFLPQSMTTGWFTFNQTIFISNSLNAMTVHSSDFIPGITLLIHLGYSSDVVLLLPTYEVYFFRSEQRLNIVDITFEIKSLEWKYFYSCIAFAVAVITVKSLLSMLSSNVSSCRRCVDLSVSLFGKKNWSTETSKSVTSS